jgi:hypothetical protein
MGTIRSLDAFNEPPLVPGPPNLLRFSAVVVPKWDEVAELVEGARARGWPEAQIDYLTAVVGITWTKAFRAGQRAGAHEPGSRPGPSSAASSESPLWSDRAAPFVAGLLGARA